MLADTVRRRINLDGPWEFAVDPRDVGEAEKWYLPEKKLPDRLDVPGSWNAQGVGGPGELGWFWGGPMKVAGSYSGTAWYKRRIAVPGDWRGKLVWINIGGVMPNLRLWVNGSFVGARFGDGLSFGYEITSYLVPGKENTITIAIDNRPERVAATRHLNLWGSWGGLFKSVVLEARSPHHIEDVFIVPSVSPPEVLLRVKVSNGFSESAAELRIEARPVGAGKACTASCSVTVDHGATDLEVKLPMPGAKPWTPDDPVLYHLSVGLIVKGETVDEWQERFGLRTLSVSKNIALLNGKPLFILATPFDGYFPPKITPPVTREEYVKIIRTIKSYGFNYLRMMWLPPLECVEAADEVGMLLQMELEEAHRKFPQHEEAILRQMLLETAYEYRNHPSFATYDLSNEHWDGTPFLSALYDLIKTIDDTRWVIDSDGSNGVPRRTSDLWFGFEEFWAYDDPKPAAGDAFSQKPVIQHEFLNIPCLPNLKEKDKYTGPMECPEKMRRLEAWLSRRNLLSRYPEFVKSSYHLMRIYGKAGAEAVRRNPGIKGYCWFENIDVDLVDVWSGVMTSFYSPKAWQPAEFRRMNAPSVLLMRQAGAPFHKQGDITPGGSATHFFGESVKLALIAGHYGAAVGNAALSWQLVAGGKVLQSGNLSSIKINAFDVTELGCVDLAVPAMPQARECVFRAKLHGAGLDLENSWNFWFFPRKPGLASTSVPVAASGGVADAIKSRYGFAGIWKPGSAPPGLLVTDSLADAMECLKNSGRVLLLSLKGLPWEVRRAGFHPGWWRANENVCLGMVLERHAAFGSFPHSGMGDWHLSRLVNEAIVAPEDAFIRPQPIEPLAYGLAMDNASLRKGKPWEPRLFVHVFQACVGKGRLLACGLNLLQDLPEAGCLLDQLVRYAASDEFKPEGLWLQIH